MPWQEYPGGDGPVEIQGDRDPLQEAFEALGRKRALGSEGAKLGLQPKIFNEERYMKKAVVTTIVTLSFCFNAFAQEAKGKDWTEQQCEKWPE